MLIDDAAFPPHLLNHLPTQEQVRAHRADRLSGPRWTTAIRDAGMPPAIGVMATDGQFSLDREQIFMLADGNISEENALQLLYLSLAWGLGWKGFRMASKMRGIGQTGEREVSRLLVEAWQSVRSGASPRDCYEVLLTPGGRPRIKQLGAAFATKYLYFAGGSQEPRIAILDAVVARSLRTLAWPTAPTTAWWSTTYESYCGLLDRWATEAAELSGTKVRMDQIEMLLFRMPAPPVS